MLFFGIKNLWFRIGLFSILTAWTAWMIAAMYRSYYIFDPYDSTLTGTAQYGHNSEGVFARILIFVLLEFGICTAVLIPWSFSRLYWLRCLILLLLSGVWTMLMAITIMHGGNVVAIHVLWLLGINIIILVLLVASIIAEFVNSRKNQAMKHS